MRKKELLLKVVTAASRVRRHWRLHVMGRLDHLKPGLNPDTSYWIFYPQPRPRPRPRPPASMGIETLKRQSRNTAKDEEKAEKKPGLTDEMIRCNVAVKPLN